MRPLVRLNRTQPRPQPDQLGRLLQHLARMTVRRHRGTQFDPWLVDPFCSRGCGVERGGSPRSCPTRLARWTDMREVLGLLARRNSSRQIAQQLVVAPRTP